MDWDILVIKITGEHYCDVAEKEAAAMLNNLQYEGIYILLNYPSQNASTSPTEKY